MVDALPQAKALLGDKGYDADWFRQALIERGITPCINVREVRLHPVVDENSFSGFNARSVD